MPALLQGRGRLVQETVTHLASHDNAHSDSKLQEAEGQLSHLPANLLGPDISTEARGGRLHERSLGQQGLLRSSFSAPHNQLERGMRTRPLDAHLVRLSV